MSERIVRHALFRYPHPTVPGVEAIVFRGQVVDLPADVEARADELGALEPVGQDAPVDVAPVVVDEVSAQPKRTAPKGDWVAYAVTQGADEDEAEATTKEDLIALYGA